MISLRQDEQEEVRAASGLSDHPVATRALPAAVSMWESETDDGLPGFDPIVIGDVRRQPNNEITAAMLEAGMVALVVVPLIAVDGRRIGALGVADAMPRRWVATDIEALGDLAALTAAAIERNVEEQMHPLRGADQLEALARLRRSFDDGLAGHAVARADGEILACNPEFARITGYETAEAAIGANLHALEPKPGAFMHLLDRLEESGLIPLEEVYFTRRDGSPARVLVRLTATRDADGRVMEIRAYMVDITQRFRDEQKLRASAERLTLLEQATQEVLWDWDVASGMVTWNDAIARRFRYRKGEVQATADWHIEKIHPDDRERVLRSMERAMQGTDTRWSDEYRILRGDGTYAAVLDRAHIMRNERGEPMRVIGAILDISEVRASEDANRLLAHASAAFESALEMNVTARTLARIGIPTIADACMVDLLRPDGTLERITVAHADPVREPFLCEGIKLDPGTDEECAPMRVVRTGNCEFGLVQNDGKRLLHIEDGAGLSGYTVVPLIAHHKALGAVTFALSEQRHRFSTLDILTIKNLVQRAALALDNAVLYDTVRRAVHARNEVLGIVSHDLRVPVNVMASALSMIKETMPRQGERTDKLLDVLGRATIQMTALIEDLLDASRLESQQFMLRNDKLRVDHLVHDTCEMLRILAAGKDIEIVEDIPDRMPHVRGDRDKLARVIGNLIGNAIKFSPRGGTIDVKAASHGPEVHIAVRDHGAGIPAEQLSKVFDRFWSGKSLHMRGAGLGLAIARGIVEAHGGRIWATSQPGSGSTFTFSLPMQP